MLGDRSLAWVGAVLKMGQNATAAGQVKKGVWRKTPYWENIRSRATKKRTQIRTGLCYIDACNRDPDKGPNTTPVRNRKKGEKVT